MTVGQPGLESKQPVTADHMPTVVNTNCEGGMYTLKSLQWRTSSKALGSVVEIYNTFVIVQCVFSRRKRRRGGGLLRGLVFFISGFSSV